MTPWYVHVWISNEYAGCYECESEEAAREEAVRRRALYGVLGCRYEVMREPVEGMVIKSMRKEPGHGEGA